MKTMVYGTLPMLKVLMVSLGKILESSSIRLSIATHTPKSAFKPHRCPAFRLEGESAGYQGTVEVGETALLETQGWALTVSVGQWLDTDLFGANSAGGVYIINQLGNLSVVAMKDASGIGKYRDIWLSLVSKASGLPAFK